MPAPETSLRPKKRPESIEAAAAAAAALAAEEAALAAEEAAVKRGNNAAARRASQDNELVKKFGDGGMTTPKPRGCGAAQMSGFRGGETY